MKKLFISTAFVLAIPAVSFANASFSSAAYANADNSNKKEACQLTPTVEPSGGATRERLQAMQKCDTGVAGVQQFTQTSNTGSCKFVPIARPSGGASRQRLQAMQKCNSGGVR